MPPLRKLLAFAAAIALLASACGGDSAESATDDITTTSAAAEPEATASDAAETTTAAPLPTDDFNGGKPEVVPEGDTPVELGIEDLIVGEGRAAEAGDMLSMHYVGVLHANGEQFDASWDRGATFDFTLGQGQVIQGWDDGIVGMQPGGRRVLTIPAEQAYGPVERGGIPADSALVFVVDLVSVTEGIPIPDPPENVAAPVTELEVTVLEEGDGAEVAVGDVIELHYQILLQPTGELIDSSYAFGSPATFTLGVDPTIPAWDQELVGKRVGDVVRMVIPAELGIDDATGTIPADATIVTEVTIVGVVG